MPKQKYCETMRLTNPEQRELFLEIIHRLHDPEAEPIQIFFTGPAGSGKTFTLKAIIESINRFTQKHNTLMNAYVATASTGKAAAAFDDITVHSAFWIAAVRALRQTAGSRHGTDLPRHV